MVSQQLLDYVRQQLAAGVLKDAIIKALATQGWTEQDVNEAFTTIETVRNIPVQIPPVQPIAANMQSAEVKASRSSHFWLIFTGVILLLFLVGVGVVFADPSILSNMKAQFGFVPVNTTATDQAVNVATTTSPTSTVPTIDQSSLTSSSGNPTITGTYPEGFSGLDLEIQDSNNKTILQDTTTIVNGRWSYYVPKQLPVGTYTFTVLYSADLKTYQNVTGTLVIANSTPRANPNPPSVVIDPGSLTTYSADSNITGTVSNVARFCIDVVAGQGVSMPTSAGLLSGLSLVGNYCSDNGELSVSSGRWSMPLTPTKAYTTGIYTLGVYNEDGGNLLNKYELTVLPASQAASTTVPVIGWVWAASPNSPKFATLEIPELNNPNPFHIYIWNGTSYTFYQDLKPLTWLQFPEGGVSKFEILGVNPALNINPLGHSVIFGITFSTSGTANFTRTAITKDTPIQ
jgi:hypothetical protein